MRMGAAGKGGFGGRRGDDRACVRAGAFACCGVCVCNTARRLPAAPIARAERSHLAMGTGRLICLTQQRLGRPLAVPGPAVDNVPLHCVVVRQAELVVALGPAATTRQQAPRAGLLRGPVFFVVDAAPPGSERRAAGVQAAIPAVGDLALLAKGDATLRQAQRGTLAR